MGEGNKVIKTQSLSSKRSSPTKGGYVHEELHKKAEQGRPVNIRLSPGSLDLQTLKRKECGSWFVEQTQDCIPYGQSK